MIGAGNIIFRGIELYIEYEYNMFISQTYESPSEGGDFNIYLIGIGDVDIIDLLDEATINEIAEQYQQEN